MRHQAPRGTEDVLPEHAHLWRHVEGIFAEIAEGYGYGEVRTPTFEDYELFVRTSGDTSDVVSKEMYDFVDKGDRRMALRPEGTAPVMRAYIEHNLGASGLPVRLRYCAPMFRYGRPQKGRLREHHQVGLELIGSPSPFAEVEVLSILTAFCSRLGASDATIAINNIGRPQERAKYGARLLAHLAPWLASLDDDAADKARKNPLRLFDSKDPSVHEALAGAPELSDDIGPESADHFAAVLAGLEEAELPFHVDRTIVRGLDYYVGTVFELRSTALGAQSALSGGGRYDGLIGALGGNDVPSVGFGMGIERALLVLEASGTAVERPQIDAFLVAADPTALSHVRKSALRLRTSHIGCQFDLDARNLKAQFKAADRSGARLALVWGQRELDAKVATLKDLRTGEQRTVAEDDLITEVTR